MTFTRRSVLGAGAAGLFAGARPAAAQEAFPSRPVRVIVPFAPGAATDILARTMANGLASLWPQPVVVENRTGASGNIGAESVARAPKDGHTLLMGTIGTNAVNQALFARMPYDTLADFDPVIHVADVPMLLVVHPSVPARSVGELVALAGQRRLTMGTAGIGASQHLAALLFAKLTGASFENVSYRGFSALVPDLIAGRLDIAFGDPLSILQQVRGGELRALAVTTAERHPLLPELPTVAEQGVAGYAAAAWYGYFAPAGCPPAVLAKLRADAATVHGRPEVQSRIRELGALPRGGSAEAFGAFVRAEAERWGAIIREAGVRAE
jgi:tripartite-type tricarboxylate transporter receptor subunit TctC